MSRRRLENPSLQAISFRLRNKLPAKQPKRVGMWSILKKFVGADLGKISLPVLLNEPITFLQRVIEPLDNIQLLFDAARERDPVLRMSYVTAFVIASYASSDERMWKPFNPLLGETYEVQRQSFRAVVEQVSHHPPITAFHAEGPNIVFNGCVAPTFKFGGQTIEVTNKGSLCIILTNLNEVYTWSVDNILTRVNNLMFGKLWMENVGKITIRNHTTGYKSSIAFLANDTRKGSVDRAEGFIKDENGHKRLFVYGKFSKFIKSVDMETYRAYVFSYPNRFDGRVLSYFNVPQQQQKQQHRSAAVYELAKEVKHKEHPVNIPNSRWVWVHNKLPPYKDAYFNFSYFAMTLNEMEPYMQIPGVLCPTDSRFRPDVRLYENGHVDAADGIKVKLENAQRQRAKERTEQWRPRWFYKGSSPFTGEESWVFRGDYWNRRYPYDPVLNNLFVAR